MKGFGRFLFPEPYSTAGYSFIILLFRIAFGLLLLRHGIDKCIHFDTLAKTFANPLGIGVELSLILAIFAEVVCSLLLIFGFLFRLCLLPLIFNMFVAAFLAFPHSTFSAKELPFLYLVVFVILFISGPGKYAVDYLIARRKPRRR